jgi:hypothetical protein
LIVDDQIESRKYNKCHFDCLARTNLGTELDQIQNDNGDGSIINNDDKTSLFITASRSSKLCGKQQLKKE